MFKYDMANYGLDRWRPQYRRSAGYRGLTSAEAPLISQPAASSPAAFRKTRQAQVKRLSDIRRRSSHHDDDPDVTAAPADLGVDTGADDGRAFLSGELAPELAADGSPLPPAVPAGHGEANVEVPGVIALDHADCPGCATTWPAAARRRRARFHLYPEPDTKSHTGV